MASTNRRIGKATTVNCAMASSSPRRMVRIKIRTLTSHASQSRSSKSDCVRDAIFIQLCNFGPDAGAACPRRISTLYSQLRDHGQHWNIQRYDDAANHHAEESDDYGFEHGQHVLGGAVHFVFVEVSDLLQHRVHCAGGFADA